MQFNIKYYANAAITKYALETYRKPCESPTQSIHTYMKYLSSKDMSTTVEISTCRIKSVKRHSVAQPFSPSRIFPAMICFRKSYKDGEWETRIAKKRNWKRAKKGGNREKKNKLRVNGIRRVRYKSTSRLRNVDLSSALVALVRRFSLSLLTTCVCAATCTRIRSRKYRLVYARRAVHTGVQAIRV